MVIQIPTLQESAMLVTVNVSMVRGRKSNKGLASEVARNHNADSESFTVIESLFPEGALSGFTTLESRVRATKDKFTLPWNQNNQHLLSADAFFKFQEEMQTHIDELPKVIDEYERKLPSYMQHGQNKRGDLFNPNDYPTADDLRRRCKIRYSIVPIPKGEDFRVRLSDGEKSRIAQAIEEQQQAQLQYAMKDVYQRLVDVVTVMRDKLSGYKAQEGETKGFTKTLVENIIGVLDLVPLLNVTNDYKLNQFADEIRKELTQYTSDDLKKDINIRLETARKADEILAKMKDFI